MNDQQIEFLLNNYPYSQSNNHYSKIFNIDWYPIATVKYGKLLCISCDQYSGVKLNNYTNSLKTSTLICKKCICLFNVCKKCHSYCVIIINKTNKTNKTNNYNIIYNTIVKLNSSLINIIYQYTLYDKLYLKDITNTDKSYSCFCPRCDKRQNVKKTDLY